jgi:hypothetical protein
MALLYKFVRLSPADRTLLLQAMVLVGLIRLGLWLLPFQMLQRSLARLQPVETGTVQLVDRELQQRTAWAVTRVSRLVPQATCLTQALATQVLLARRQQPAVLRIGVARDERGNFIAHAWVESAEHIVIGNLPGLDGFTPLPPLEVNRL